MSSEKDVQKRESQHPAGGRAGASGTWPKEESVEPEEPAQGDQSTSQSRAETNGTYARPNEKPAPRHQ